MMDDSGIEYEVRTKAIGTVIKPQIVGLFVHEKDYPSALKLLED